MALSSGTRLGPYEIVSALGAGGMGEVYRATDTRLGRQVAIKVLPATFDRDIDRRTRFEREAKAVAALSHPNILAIHDFGTTAGITYAVTELLHGETVRDRVSKGPMPVSKTIDIATQIARGLAAAHDKGIVHRDLKPENIFLTRDGHVKILDFGLAKQAAPAASGDHRTELATEPGMVMGTVGYMAPEQVRGEPVDARTDLFAFGAVLYEMLTGSRAFKRDTTAETMTAILKDDPADLSASRADLPPSLDRVVRHALEKDPNDRFQSARDLVFNLQAIGQSPSSGPSAAMKTPLVGRRPYREMAAWTVAVIATAIAGVAVMRRTPADETPGRIANLTLAGEADMSASSPGPGVLVSPDGSHVFYQSSRGDRRLFIRAIESSAATALSSGGEPGRLLAIAPDGRWILFSTLTTLKKLSLIDNSVTSICQTNTIASNAAVSARGQIVFSTGVSLWTVSADGGTPQLLTKLDADREQSHVVGGFLPDGQTLLFTNWLSDHPRIEALTLTTGERRVVIDQASGGKYLSSGYLLFVRDGALMASSFDVQRLTTSGTPARVLDHIRTDAFGLPKMGVSSDGGVLVYADLPISSLVWVSRAGFETPLELTPRGFQFVRLAGDSRRLGFADGDGVWIADLARGGTTHISSGRFVYGLLDWSPDGSRIAYAVRNELITTASDGTGAVVQLGKDIPVRKLAPSWSPDGKTIAYSAYFGATNGDIYVEPADGSGPARPFVVTPAYDAGVQFSPDGHFVAYASSESGRLEVYVTPFPGPGPRWPVSVNGGTQTRWSRDGRELYYRQNDDMMAVSITTTPSFSAGKPVVLFHNHYSYGSGLGPPTYDVAADGRFLMIRNDDETVERPRIIVNWAGALKRAMAAR